MVKIFAFVLIAVVAAAVASRNVRSPGGSGWQGASSRYTGPPAFGAGRSSVSSWTGYGGGSGLARSSGDGGWQTNSWSGSDPGLRSGNSWSPNGNRFSELGRSSNGWGNSGADYEDNNGWQSASW